MKITLLGAGAWGTALAKVLHENGNGVTLWDIDTALLDEIRLGRSERYLPGIALPVNWKVEVDFGKAVGGAECVVMAVPSNVFRPWLSVRQGDSGLWRLAGDYRLP